MTQNDLLEKNLYFFQRKQLSNTKPLRYKSNGINRFLQLMACALVGAMAVFGSVKVSADNDYQSLGMPKFIIGVGTHFSYGHGNPKPNILMMKQAGIMSTREECTWNKCEKIKGKLSMPSTYIAYNKFAFENGLYPVNILDYGNWNYGNGDYPRSPEAVEGYARYCEYTVTSLKGVSRLYQVWNEWIAGCSMPKAYFGKGDPESYMKLLKTVYPRIKKADPQAIIISGGISSRGGPLKLEKLLKMGMLEYCDVVSLHTYNYYKKKTTPEDWLESMVKVDETLRKYSGGKEVPMYITEMGYPTHIGNGNTPEKSATYLARIYLLAKTLPYIKGIWWYDFQDDGWKSEYNQNNYGMVRPDLTPKPSYMVMSDISNLVANGRLIERIDVGDPMIWIFRYSYADGKQAIAMWSSHDDHGWQISLKNNAADKKPVTVRRVGNKAINRRWGTYGWDQNRKNPKITDNILKLTIRDRPWIVEGDLANVTITQVVKREFRENARPKNTLIQVPKSIGTALHINAGKTNEINFGSAKALRKFIGTVKSNKNDLDASFSLAYEADKLYLTVKVTDDVFSQENSGAYTWQGDGIQFALKNMDTEANNGNRYTEIDMALTKDGPLAYLRKTHSGAKVGPMEKIDLKITQKGKVTTYKIVLPVKAVDLPKLRKNRIIGFSILVNDNDGNGRESYLHWGDGIASAKNPFQYNWISMQ